MVKASIDSHERFGNDGCETGSDGWALVQCVKAAAGRIRKSYGMVSQSQTDVVLEKELGVSHTCRVL